jgi:hypothetical protein
MHLQGGLRQSDWQRLDLSGPDLSRKYSVLYPVSQSETASLATGYENFYALHERDDETAAAGDAGRFAIV